MNHPRDGELAHPKLAYDGVLVVLLIVGIINRDPRVSTVVAGLALLDEPIRRTPSPRL